MGPQVCLHVTVIQKSKENEKEILKNKVNFTLDLCCKGRHVYLSLDYKLDWSYHLRHRPFHEFSILKIVRTTMKDFISRRANKDHIKIMQL